MNGHVSQERDQVQPAIALFWRPSIYAFSQVCQARQRAAGLAILNGIRTAKMACFDDK
jgi:hypothetical protein